MTAILNPSYLDDSAVNPFAETLPRRVPVLHWTLDQRKRPVALWRLEVQPVPGNSTVELALAQKGSCLRIFLSRFLAIVGMLMRTRRPT
jgi:hypothetical protein